MNERPYNKSLHPIWPPVKAFARCSRGVANALPGVQTGELNRYIFCRWPHSTQGRPFHQEPWRASVAGPSRATRKIMTSDGRPARSPFFMVGCMPPTNYNVQHMSLTELIGDVPSLGKLRKDCRFYSVGQPGWLVIRPRAGQERFPWHD